MPRSRNITDKDVEEIVTELATWSGKLTWALLIEHLVKLGRPKWTRQALFKFSRITSAFQARKEKLGALGQTSVRAKSPQLRAALQRNERLQAQVDELNASNKRLLEQFRRWATNAAQFGLTLDKLDREIPPSRYGERELQEMAAARKKKRQEREKNLRSR